ncbi:unnamed protein product [Peniophora sp. CBMAI 1063]|nr:unnamed protein product [Peniophora sp. CBMAI 1063]
MLLPRGPEVGREERVPCHYCNNRARPDFDAPGYIAFTDNLESQMPSRGQVWSIRESLMLPIAEFLKTADLELVKSETRSGKSRSTTLLTWIRLHGSRERPRPCIILKATKREKKIHLMGTLSDGQFEDLSLCADMFCIQVDPSPHDCSLNPSEQHIHSTPRWCPTKKQYVCVLPIEFKGHISEKPEKPQGYVIERWVERHGTPEENGQHYGFSERQLNRLNFISQARLLQWQNMDKTSRQNAIREFRKFATKHILTEPGPDGASQRSRSGAPSFRTKKTGSRKLFGGLSALTRTEARPATTASKDAGSIASPTRSSFARDSSRASARR